jgi:2-polyprenyl-3-methyl-5-hydroxy-6-metoxy-1,4-benzoquinol methylase
MKARIPHTPKEPQPPDTSLGAYYAYFEHIARTLVKYFRIHTALDIGCNTGSLVKAFKDLGIEAYGVDVSQAAISNAPKELRGQLCCLDVTRDRLPFEDEKFDLITMSEVVEHLRDFQNTLCEIRRVLKVNGHIYVTTPSMPGADILSNLMHLSRLTNPTHINVHSKKFWVKLFESHGLEYLYDFPKAERKKALTAVFKSKFSSLIVKIYSMPLIPDLRSSLIFQKRL